MPKRRRPSKRSRRKLSEQEHEKRSHAVTLMRAGESLTEAARELGIAPSRLVKIAPGVIYKGANGRYQVQPFDRYRRTLFFLAADDRFAITVHSSITATKIAQYWDAVDRYGKGERTALDEFRGKSIKVGKTRYPFVTDPDVLKTLGRAGRISFEDIYATNY